MSRLALALVLALAAPAMAMAANELSGANGIAVLDIQGTGISPELLPTLTEVLTVEISELALYKVIAGRDIQSMLGFERQKDVLGCTDAACLAEIGGALGVDRIVASHIGMVGSTYVVNIKLINIRMADTEARVYETVRGEVDALIATVRKSVKKLLGPGSKAALALTGGKATAPATEPEPEPESTTAQAAPQPSTATGRNRSGNGTSTGNVAANEPATKPTPTAPPPPTTVQAQGEHGGIGAMPWVLWSVGTGVAGIGAVVGIKAKDEAKKANDRTQPGSQRSAEEAPKLAKVATMCLAGGGALFAGGILWAVIRGTSSSSSTAFAPMLSHDTIGIAASAQF